MVKLLPFLQKVMLFVVLPMMDQINKLEAVGNSLEYNLDFIAIVNGFWESAKISSC